MWIDMEQPGEKRLAHQVGENHAGRVRGGIDLISGPQAAKRLPVLGLPRAFPEMVVMIAGDIEDILLKKSLTVWRKDQFDEALKDHGGLMDISQGHFENIAIEDERRLFRVGMARDQLSQAGHKGTHYRAGTC